MQLQTSTKAGLRAIKKIMMMLLFIHWTSCGFFALANVEYLDLKSKSKVLMFNYNFWIP